MILTRDEFIKAISERIGEDNSDEAIALLENVSDTYDDLAGRAEGDGEDWKAKYEENDAQWRERYRARFEGRGEDTTEVVVDEETKEETEDEPETFEDLFEYE